MKWDEVLALSGRTRRSLRQELAIRLLAFVSTAVVVAGSVTGQALLFFPALACLVISMGFYVVMHLDRVDRMHCRLCMEDHTDEIAEPTTPIH